MKKSGMIQQEKEFYSKKQAKKLKNYPKEPNELYKS